MNKQETREFFEEKAKEYNLPDEWKFKLCNGYSRIGYCNASKKIVSISRELIKNGTDKEIKDVVLHELAHALAPKGAKHNWQWKSLLISIGGDGKRTHSYSLNKPVNYVLTCDCGYVKRNYMKKPSLDLKRYSCRTCGSKLKVCKCDEDE